MSDMRLTEYDFTRVIAMLCVVAVHCLSVVDTRGPVALMYFTFGQAAFFTANAIFFMLSGKFNLTDRAASNPGDFYLRKIRGIVIPVLIFFFLRTLYNLYPGFGSVDNVLRSFATNALTDFNSMEYWFVFTLISLLMVAPFLANMVKGMNFDVKRLFFWLGIVWFVVLFAFNNLGVGFSWSYLFTGFCFPFVAGAFIEELFEKRKDKLRIWILSLLALCLSVFLFRSDVREGIFDDSPLYMLASTGLFLALVSLGRRIKGERATQCVAFVARHSFSVYLVHMVVRHHLLAVAPIVEGIASIGFHVVFTLAVALVSLVVAVVLDTILVKSVQGGFDGVVKRIGGPR